MTALSNSRPWVRLGTFVLALVLLFSATPELLHADAASDKKAADALKREERRNTKIVMKKSDQGANVENSEAYVRFKNLGKAVQKFSIVLLVLGIILAGILFMTGKTSFFLMTLGGTVVVFGGPFVVTLVMDALLSAPREVLFTEAYQTEYVPITKESQTPNPLGMERMFQGMPGAFRLVGLNDNPLSGSLFQPGIHVQSLAKAADNVPLGQVLPWKKDGAGRPMVTLVVAPTFFHRPTDANGQLVPGAEPQKYSIYIRQLVVFSLGSDESWSASAGAISVVLNDGASAYDLLPGTSVETWNSPVGVEGMLIGNVMGAGLAASEANLKQFFSEQELRDIAASKNDVVFYLRRVD